MFPRLSWTCIEIKSHLFYGNLAKLAELTLPTCLLRTSQLCISLEAFLQAEFLPHLIGFSNVNASLQSEFLVSLSSSHIRVFFSCVHTVAIFQNMSLESLENFDTILLSSLILNNHICSCTNTHCPNHLTWWSVCSLFCVDCADVYGCCDFCRDTNN